GLVAQHTADGISHAGRRGLDGDARDRVAELLVGSEHVRHHGDARRNAVSDGCRTLSVGPAAKLYGAGRPAQPRDVLFARQVLGDLHRAVDTPRSSALAKVVRPWFPQ